MAESDFRSMQEEAVKRVMEMQRRSRSYTQEGGMSGMSNSSETANTAGAVGLNGLNTQSVADYSGGDEEKAMIALLIYILYKNKADMKLLLGLGYLLL